MGSMNMGGTGSASKPKLMGNQMSKPGFSSGGMGGANSGNMGFGGNSNIDY